MEIMCATSNKGKAAEIAAVLASDGYSVLTLEEVGIDMNVTEDGETFEENAVKKAVEIMRLCGKPVLADDSGLEVDALDGGPGVYSARFLGESTPYSEKNRRMLEMIKGTADRGARFVCVIAVAFPDGRVLTAKGVLEGEIAQAQAGEGGFGYDPIFYMPVYGITLAQMSPEQKNKISHRGQALAKIKELISEA